MSIDVQEDILVGIIRIYHSFLKRSTKGFESLQTCMGMLSLNRRWVYFAICKILYSYQLSPYPVEKHHPPPQILKKIICEVTTFFIILSECLWLNEGLKDR